MNGGYKIEKQYKKSVLRTQYRETEPQSNRTEYVVQLYYVRSTDFYCRFSCFSVLN